MLKSNQAQGAGSFHRTVPGTLGQCYFDLSGGVKAYVVYHLLLLSDFIVLEALAVCITGL